MSTVAELIDQARDELLGGRREVRNRLNGIVPDQAADTTVTLVYDIAGVGRGTVIEAGLESWYVWDSDTALQQVTVQRGYDGSDTAAHADGETVTVGPEFPRRHLYRAMLRELRSLVGEGLSKFESGEVSVSSSTVMYDLGAASGGDVLGVYQARWYGEDGRSTPLAFRHLQDQDVAKFPSGHAVQLQHPSPRGGTVQFVWRETFDEFTSESEDVQSVCGVPSYAEEILVLGAALRMASAKEARRLSTGAQPSPRQADDVPPRAFAMLSEQLRQRRDRAVAEALAAQRASHPLRIAG